MRVERGKEEEADTHTRTETMHSFIMSKHITNLIGVYNDRVNSTTTPHHENKKKL